MKLLTAAGNRIAELDDVNIAKTVEEFLPDSAGRDPEDYRAIIEESLIDMPEGELAPLLDHILGRDEFEKLVREGLNDPRHGEDENDGTDGGDDVNPNWRREILEECSVWLLAEEEEAIREFGAEQFITDPLEARSAYFQLRKITNRERREAEARCQKE